MFAKLKSMFVGKTNEISGRLDILQAVTAAGCLVGASDGDFSDKEVASVKKSVLSNQTLASAFADKDINSTLNTMISRAEGGRVGKLELYREIEEVAAKGDLTTNIIILAGALDVAEAEGGMDENEQKELEKIATKLNLKLSDYL